MSSENTGQLHKIDAAKLHKIAVHVAIRMNADGVVEM